MSFFRKKPVVIEAMMFDGSSTSAGQIQHWMDTGEVAISQVSTCDIRNFEIKTLEGVMTANPGDWVIKGVQGEFYPCKPEIFAATYEAAHPTEVSDEPTIGITSVNTFAQLIIGWHRRRVLATAHFLEVPEGQEVQIGDDPPITLTGDAHKAFLIGINLSLNELGTLPFVAEVVKDEPEVEVAAEPGADYVKG